MLRLLVPRRCHLCILFLGVALGSAWLDGLAWGDDWPQWLGPRRDGVWREQGIVAQLPATGPKVRWRASIGAGYSGPTVADGKVYLTDRILAKGARNPDNPFSTANRVEGSERVLCLEEKTGKLLWEHSYPCLYQVSYGAGPRASPLVSGNRVYTLGTMGDLLCLDTDTGKVVWSRNFLKDFNTPEPIWGFAGHPLLDGDRLICLVGGQGSVAVAFHKDTGKELWRNLSAKEPGYAPPMLYQFGGKQQLILWHPESVNSLDPQTGQLYWSQPFAKRALRAGMSIPTPRQAGDRLYLTAFYDGSLMLQVKDKAEVVWRSQGRSEKPDGTDTLHCVMSTPFLIDGHIYGVCSYGELRCLKADTGERLWSTDAPTGGKSSRWANAFLVQHQDRFFLFNEHGDLIIAKLTPKGYQEISRARILEATNTMAPPPGRRVIWSHPAFANRSIYARNDRELVCISLAAE